MFSRRSIKGRFYSNSNRQCRDSKFAKEVGVKVLMGYDKSTFEVKGSHYSSGWRSADSTMVGDIPIIIILRMGGYSCSRIWLLEP